MPDSPGQVHSLPGLYYTYMPAGAPERPQEPPQAVGV